MQLINNENIRVRFAMQNSLFEQNALHGLPFTVVQQFALAQFIIMYLKLRCCCSSSFDPMSRQNRSCQNIDTNQIEFIDKNDFCSLFHAIHSHANRHSKRQVSFSSVSLSLSTFPCSFHLACQNDLILEICGDEKIPILYPQHAYSVHIRVWWRIYDTYSFLFI